MSSGRIYGLNGTQLKAMLFAKKLHSNPNYHQLLNLRLCIKLLEISINEGSRFDDLNENTQELFYKTCDASRVRFKVIAEGGKILLKDLMSELKVKVSAAWSSVTCTFGEDKTKIVEEAINEFINKYETENRKLNVSKPKRAPVKIFDQQPNQSQASVNPPEDEHSPIMHYLQ